MAVVERNSRPFFAHLEQQLVRRDSCSHAVSGFLTPGRYMRLKMDAASNGVFRQQPAEPVRVLGHDGDLGTVVYVYDGGYEVEFFTAT